MAVISYKRPDGAIVETDPNWSVPALPAYTGGTAINAIPNSTMSLQQAATVPMVNEGGAIIPARPILNRRGPTQVAWGIDPINGSVSPMVGAYSAYPHVVYAPQYLGAAGLLDVVSRAVANNPYAQQAMMVARSGGGAIGGGGGMGGGGGVGGGAGGVPSGPSAQVKTQQQNSTPTGNRGVRARDIDTYSAYDAVSKNILGPLGDMSNLQSYLGTDSDTLSMIADLLQSSDPAIREQAKGLADVAAQQAINDYEQGQALTRQFYHPESADAALSRSGDMTVRSMMENRPTYTDPQAMIEEYRRANMKQAETDAAQATDTMSKALTMLGVEGGLAAAIAPALARSEAIRRLGIYPGSQMKLARLFATPWGRTILRQALAGTGWLTLPMLGLTAIEAGREMGMDLENWTDDSIIPDFE